MPQSTTSKMSADMPNKMVDGDMVSPYKNASNCNLQRRSYPLLKNAAKVGITIDLYRTIG